jgi:hypothetical protein
MVRPTSIALALVLVLNGPSTVLIAQCERSKAALATTLGERYQFGTSIGANDRSKTIPPVAVPETKYVRVRIEVAPSQGCDQWVITVRDAKFRAIQTFGKADFANSAARWSTRIDGTQALVEIDRCEPNRPIVRLDEYILMPEKANSYYSSETDEPAWDDLYSVTEGIRPFGDFVGMFLSSYEQLSWVCSGIALSPRLFLTNWHCGGPRQLEDTLLWNDVVRKDALIDMSWDSDALSREFVVDTKVADDPALDFALLRITPLDNRGPLRPIVARRSRVTFQEPVYLVHHPRGERKRISVTHCQVDNVTYDGWRNAAAKTEFTHRCDSDGGSSGGAIFDEKGQLVGLHHLGYNYSALCVSDQRNKAVHMADILDFLERRRKAVLSELQKKPSTELESVWAEVGTFLARAK